MRPINLMDFVEGAPPVYTVTGRVLQGRRPIPQSQAAIVEIERTMQDYNWRGWRIVYGKAEPKENKEGQYELCLG